MRDSPVTSFITALDCGDIMTGFLVTMPGDGVALRIMHLSVAVRLYCYFLRAVPEVPEFAALLNAEAAHLEGDFIAGFDAKGRVIDRMNSRRHLVGIIPVDYLDDGEVIINVT